MFHHFPRFLLRLRTSEQDFVWEQYTICTSAASSKPSGKYRLEFCFLIGHDRTRNREILNGQSLIPKDSCPQAISSTVLLGRMKSQMTPSEEPNSTSRAWHEQGCHWSFEKKRVPVICDFKGIIHFKAFQGDPCSMSAIFSGLFILHPNIAHSLSFLPASFSPCLYYSFRQDVSYDISVWILLLRFRAGQHHFGACEKIWELPPLSLGKTLPRLVHRPWVTPT